MVTFEQETVNAMLTRKEIEAAYTVSNGVIRSSGKFEGEPVWSPYFFEAYMEGDGEDCGDCVTFTITDQDVNQFPELTGVTWIEMHTTDDGFVVCTKV